MHVEERFEESLLLIVLFKEFLAESAFLGGQAQQFAVEKPAVQLFGQHLGNGSSATAQLPSYAYGQVVISFHQTSFYVVA